jgi:Holliday junction resolvasome RuvABC endonuclease subunit
VRILALDLGTHCGWALRDGDVVTSGTWDLAPHGNREMPGRRFLRFRQALIKTGKVDQVVFEEVTFHSGSSLASHLWGAWWGLLLSWCETHQIPYRGVKVADLKKQATGNAKADKVEMIKAMKMLGHDPYTDDEADALALLHYHEATSGSARR